MIKFQEQSEPIRISEIRKLPKEFQNKIWEEQSVEALKIFNKHQELYDVPEIFDDMV